MANDDKRWTSTRYDGGYLEGPIETVIAKLQEALAAQERGEWRNLSLEIQEEYGSCSIILTGQRIETNEERAKREQFENGQKAYRRLQYEQLKKEFEKKE